MSALPRHLLCVAVLAAARPAAAAEARGLEFFEAKIRPVLVAECLDCHSAKKRKGGLALDHRAGWEKGGDSGAAIVPRKPDDSLLIQTIRHEDADRKMPQKAPKLDDAVIADFVEWVKIGAPDPRDTPQGKEAGGEKSWAEKLAERKAWWCFQPIADPPLPEVRDKSWSQHPIDRFILARLEAKGLAPAPPADEATLTRRLAFALTGLPPCAEPLQNPMIQQLVGLPDFSLPDASFHRFLRTLMLNPAFGEHWARHWMDLARYAETYGSEHDYLNPHAWRYRDYLIHFFNWDLPYDRFIEEQIAGDLLEPRWDPRTGLNEALLGAAWHRMIESYATPVDVKREEATAIEWQIENLGKTFLGLTINCARCHDHKFDPISDEDYYALYGVFASTRPTLSILDDPAKLTAHDAALAEPKELLQHAVAQRWHADLVPSRLEATLAREGQHPLAELRDLATAADFPAAWTALRARHTARPAPEPTPFADLTLGELDGWRVSGPGLPAHPVRAGSFSVGSGKSVIGAIRPAGYFSDVVSDRHGGSLRSPEFILEKPFVSALASGSGKARLRLVVENFQNDLLLFKQVNPDLDTAVPRWFTLKVKDQWLGRRARLELLTRDDKTCVGHTKDQVAWEETDGRSAFGLLRVVFHDGDAPRAPSPFPAVMWTAEPKSWTELISQLSRLGAAALSAWESSRATDEDTRWLQALLAAGVFHNETSERPDRGPSGTGEHMQVARYLTRYRIAEMKIPLATRAPGVCDDGYSYDSPLFPRGDHLQPVAPVPRRFLEVLGGAPLGRTGSGRLALAREITRRDNPLTARVMANRIWQHLFGRGLVATPDNFGKMGEKPTHPELLDHLATRFSNGSVKQLVRYIVTSRTWQLSSTPPPQAEALDPNNALLSHAHVRRLEAECIRDAMLAVAGNLKEGHSGPGVRPWYRTEIDPDKQPKPGPLDGDGRRSVYLEVRRNFPNEFLTVFDCPKPNTVTGRRSETNVPAQSLALLNDPFVLHQARVWAERLAGSDEERVATMYRRAFARAPSADEIASALAFVRNTETDPWPSMAHAIFNMKEFIYVR